MSVTMRTTRLFLLISLYSCLAHNPAWCHSGIPADITPPSNPTVKFASDTLATRQDKPVHLKLTVLDNTGDLPVPFMLRLMRKHDGRDLRPSNAVELSRLFKEHP